MLHKAYVRQKIAKQMSGDYSSGNFFIRPIFDAWMNFVLVGPAGESSTPRETKCKSATPAPPWHALADTQETSEDIHVFQPSNGDAPINPSQEDGSERLQKLERKVEDMHGEMEAFINEQSAALGQVLELLQQGTLPAGGMSARPGVSAICASAPASAPDIKIELLS